MIRPGGAPRMLPAEDALAGAVADIGIEQDRSPPALVCDLDEPRQRRPQRSQTVQLFVAESIRVPGGPARCVSPAIGSEKRQRDIVGDAFGTHVVEKRKALAFGIVETMPD